MDKKTIHTFQLMGAMLVISVFMFGFVIPAVVGPLKAQVTPTPTVTVTASEEPTEEATPEETEEEPTTAPASKDDIFEKLYTKQFEDEFGYPPSKGVLKAARGVAKAVCKAFDAGASAEEIMTVLINGSKGDKDVLKANTIAAGVGVGYYCSEHMGKLD